MRRVVVTGLGMVTPLGNTVADNWKALLNAESGIGLIEHFDASDLNCRICGFVKQFDASQYMPEKEIKKRDFFIQYGIAAAIQAIRDSGLEVTDSNCERIGVALGSGIGGLPAIERAHLALMESGVRKISPFFIPSALINMFPGYLSIDYGFRGPNISVVSACTTGTHNIGLAAREIMFGAADVMIAGAAEMASTKLGIAGFASMRALSQRNDSPKEASRPWDKGRDGFVLSDGAGVLVLEEYECAKARGARIYAELIGFGMSGDAWHMTTPHPEGLGAALSMQAALKSGNISASRVSYINAHATSTQAGDELELMAIKKVFGEHAKQLAVSSTKSMTGHLLGAAGAVEAIYSVLALRDQVAPPTINLHEPSESCDLNLVPHRPQEMKIDVVLSNSFGFGGTNASLMFVNV